MTRWSNYPRADSGLISEREPKDSALGGDEPCPVSQPGDILNMENGSLHMDGSLIENIEKTTVRFPGYDPRRRHDACTFEGRVDVVRHEALDRCIGCPVGSLSEHYNFHRARDSHQSITKGYSKTLVEALLREYQVTSTGIHKNLTVAVNKTNETSGGIHRYVPNRQCL